MQFDEHQGMRLWIESDDNLSNGVVKLGSDVNLKIGVEPADASNKVIVKYRVNGGPVAAIAADPVRHTGNTQYYNAQLPCAALCDGVIVDYSAICQCAGRQIPSASKAEEFASSFRVSSVNSTGAKPNSSYSTTHTVRQINPTAADFSPTPGYQAIASSAKRLNPTHLSLFVLTRNSGHPIARMPFYAEVGVSSFVPIPKPECKLKELIIYIFFELEPLLRDPYYSINDFTNDFINADPRNKDYIEILS